MAQDFIARPAMGAVWLHRRRWEMAVRGQPESGSHPDTRFRRVNWSDDLEIVRRLLQEYRQWLADHVVAGVVTESTLPVGLGTLDKEIANLPGVYGPPRGEIILAFEHEALVACGALHELEPRIGEIRRVYVRADHRGKGFGPRLTGALLDRARELEYERVRVDTLPTMAAAIEFYQEMGFKPIPAYWPHPVRGALFFEYDVLNRRPTKRPDRTSTPRRPRK